MKKIILVALLAFGQIVLAQSKYEIDASHTNVMFTVSHLVISDVTGDFKEFTGFMTSSKPDFSDAQAEMTIKTASVNTDNEKRDGHLKSDDFFAAEKFPDMKFKSKSFTKTGDNTYKIAGDLTIRGVTKAVELEGIYKGEVSAWGSKRQGWNLSGSLDRFDYGLQWDKAMETGNLIVGKIVKLNINAELVKK